MTTQHENDSTTEVEAVPVAPAVPRLEKCYFCAYGEGEASDLVAAKCAHHLEHWDPTIENVEKRAALLPYEAPAITDVTDPEKAQDLRNYIEGVGFDPSADRGHSPAGDPAWMTREESDRVAANLIAEREGPATPKDQSRSAKKKR